MGLSKLVDLFFFSCGKGASLHDTLNKQIFRTLFQGQKGELLRLFFFHDRNSFGSRAQIHIDFFIVDHHRGPHRLIALAADIVQPGGKETVEPVDCFLVCGVVGISLVIYTNAAVLITESPKCPSLFVDLEVHIRVIHPVAVLHIVMLHAVMGTVFMVNDQRVVGFSGLQPQILILTGHNLREQLLKAAEILVRRRVSLDGRRCRLLRCICGESRFGGLHNSMGILVRNGCRLVTGCWCVVFHLNNRRWLDRFHYGFSGFIGNRIQDIIEIRFSDGHLPVRTAHFINFIRDVIIPDGIRLLLYDRIGIVAVLDHGVQ